MPSCYQCNDSKREISEKIYTRDELGLPKDAFVFACFNANNKITSVEFDIWMNLLRKVGNSVLWLYKSNDFSVKNLKKESKKRGIQSSRLIFADRFSNKNHLSRIRSADLFLDTFNYNAHTTASDSLWSGGPVLTKHGQSISARVCSSLLTALNLEEMIVKDNNEYEKKALFIATNKSYLMDLKVRLNKNKKNSELYNTEKFTRNLEHLYIKMIEKFKN